jgi:hypothetical protein
MRPRTLVVLAVTASLSVAFLPNGDPLPGAAGQERAAGTPGVPPPAPSPTGIPLQERAGRECGLNSLFLLLQLSGHNVSYKQTREAVVIGPNGSSLSELQQAASRLGVKTAVSRCSMAELMHMPKPVIAYLRLETGDTPERAGHYVVVMAANENGVEFIDGTFATALKDSASNFEAVWSGHVLAPAAAQGWVRPLALIAAVGLWVGMGLACWRARVLRRAEVAHPPAALEQPEGTRP